MKKEGNIAKWIWVLATGLAGALTIILGVFSNDSNRFAIGFIQILAAVALYFVNVLVVAQRNWMDIRAVFAAAWMATIGLATLRLSEYQEIWQIKTWFMLAGALFAFQIGGTLGIDLGKKYYPKTAKLIQKISPIRLALKENRLYYICVGVTVFGFLCFAANVAIRGYIPFLIADVNNSYAEFYTKFYLFAVAATMISGLCYYCLKTQKCSWGRKIILIFCILYSTILFPLMVVSRGTMMTSALSLATVVFYVHRKKLVPLIVCAVTILVVYLLASNLRGYTAEQLNYFFRPAQIPIATAPVQTDPVQTDPPQTAPPQTDPVQTEPPQTEPPQTEPPQTEPAPTEPVPTTPQKVFVLPPRVAFLYSYLTIGHDNFNEAVQNSKVLTYGIRQLIPFNVILRSTALNSAIQGLESYKVRDYLNVTNLIGDAYYDFRFAGLLLVMLWALIFGVLQGCTESSKGPFALLALGNAMTPVVMATFATWMSVFSHWMHWGVVLILCVIACIGKKNKTS